MRKVPDYVTWVCEECNPGVLPYCWRCNRNPKVARKRGLSQHLPEPPKEETLMEWISVKDKMPKPFTPVLCTAGTAVVPQIWVSGINYMYDSWKVLRSEWYDLAPIENPTHWMPLPTAPKEE